MMVDPCKSFWNGTTIPNRFDARFVRGAVNTKPPFGPRIEPMLRRYFSSGTPNCSFPRSREGQLLATRPAGSLASTRRVALVRAFDEGQCFRMSKKRPYEVRLCETMRQAAFFDHILHQPFGLMVPSTTWQAFGGSNRRQLAQLALPFGES